MNQPTKTPLIDGRIKLSFYGMNSVFLGAQSQKEE